MPIFLVPACGYVSFQTYCDYIFFSQKNPSVAYFTVLLPLSPKKIKEKNY
jgi:hypothetical protein